MKIGPAVIIKRVRIKNFLSIHSAEINFEKFTGVNLVQGINSDVLTTGNAELLSNGSGKSSLFSAILFGLYGETIHNVNIQSICHKLHLNENVEVEIELNGVDNKAYRILTIIEKLTSCHIHVFENGEAEPVNSVSLRETRRFIENKIIGISSDIFRRRVLLVDDGNQDFFNLRSDKKLQFIENSFGLNIFGEMYRNIHQDFLKLQREMVSIEQEHGHICKTLDDLVNTGNRFEITRNEKISEKQRQINNELKFISNILNLNTVDIAKINATMNKLDEEIISTEENASRIKSEINRAEKIKFKIEHKLYSYNETMLKYSRIIEQLCEECKKNVEIKLFDNFNAENGKDINDKITDVIKILRLSLQNKESKLKQLLLERSKIKSTIKSLSIFKHSLAEIYRQKSPFGELIAQNKKSLEYIENLREQKQRAYKFLNFADYVTSENGVKQFIIKDILNELNIRLQHYIAKFSGSFSCKFDEKFNAIFTNGETEMEYNNFSNGEKVRLKLAVLFVFRDMLFAQASVNFNMLVIDEFFDSSLDDFALEKLIEILQNISKQQKCSIFIISHRDIIKDKSALFSGRILIEKHNGESSIKVKNE